MLVASAVTLEGLIFCVLLRPPLFVTLLVSLLMLLNSVLP